MKVKAYKRYAIAVTKRGDDKYNWVSQFIVEAKNQKEAREKASHIAKSVNKNYVAHVGFALSD